MKENVSADQLLQWYMTAGVNETIGDMPVDHFNTHTPKEIVSHRQASVSVPPPAIASAPTDLKTESLLRNVTTLEELRNIIENFNDCPLKATATKMVFGSGNPDAQLMIIGEAPGKEEDRQGLPFVGASGHLLDLMLNSIGLTRQDVYISNILPWRPPANRKPSEAEVALFTPFVKKHIALIKPKVLLLLGGSAVSAVLNTNIGITKARGQWQKYIDDDLTVDVMPSFHPAFLLRTPAQKKFSWRDLMAVKKNLGV